MMKLKLEEEYSHLKLWPLCNISYELDSFFFVFLLTLFISFDIV